MNDNKLAILKNDGFWSERKYSIVEKGAEFSTLEDDEGSKVKIFNDRISDKENGNISSIKKITDIVAPKENINSDASVHIKPATKSPEPQTKSEKDKQVSTTKTKATKPAKSQKPEELKKFNPNSIYENVDGREVYCKENEFNGTTTCKTFVVLDINGSKRFIINTYDDIAKGGVEYPVKDSAKTIQKLINDGYKKV